MSDTNETSDDRVVARLRSALDELTSDVEPRDAGGSGHGADDLVAVRPIAARTRRRGAWLGAAAATVLLAGGAVWALSTRSDDPVADSDTVPPTATPSTTDGAGVRPAAPAYSITSARLAPGRVITDEAPAAAAPMFVAWRIVAEAADGFLFGSVYDDANVLDGATTEPLDPPEGTAQLVFPPVTDSEFVAPYVEWDRADGSVWVFQSQGLYSAVSSNDWIDLVFSAVPGSGVPIVLPDERASVLAVGGPSTSVVTQAYTAVDGGTVDLTVSDGGASLFALTAAADVREVTVAGDVGWLGTYADGHVEVVWHAGGGWWGLLGISPELADQADDIIASVVRTDTAPPAETVPTPAPATETGQLYEVTGRIEEQQPGIDVVLLPAESPYQASVELRGVDWDAVDAQVLPDGRRTTGTVRLVVRRVGDALELVGLRAATSEPPADVCQEHPTELDPIVAALDQRRDEAFELGVVTWVIADFDEDSCNHVTVYAFEATPEVQNLLAPYGDLVDLCVVLTPA